MLGIGATAAGLWAPARAGSAREYLLAFTLLYLALTVLLVTRFPARLDAIVTVAFWLTICWWFAGGLMGGGSTSVILLAIIITAGYLLFSTGAALRLSLALSGLDLLLLGAGSLRPAFSGGWPVDVEAFAQHLASLLALVVLLHALSKSKDDLAAEQIKSQELRVAAYEDVVTGLLNRRRLEERLDQEISAAQRHGRPISLVLFDLDQFKSVHDTYGHDVGDEILHELARALAPVLRGGDTLGRWGGEEFLIIAPDTDASQARFLAERLRERIRLHEFRCGQRITASFGVAGRMGFETPKELLRLADQALYEAKAGGRDRTAIAGQGLAESPPDDEIPELV